MMIVIKLIPWYVLTCDWFLPPALSPPPLRSPSKAKRGQGYPRKGCHCWLCSCSRYSYLRTCHWDKQRSNSGGGRHQAHPLIPMRINMTRPIEWRLITDVQLHGCSTKCIYWTKGENAWGLLQYIKYWIWTWHWHDFSCFVEFCPFCQFWGTGPNLLSS